MLEDKNQIPFFGHFEVAIYPQGYCPLFLWPKIALSESWRVWRGIYPDIEHEHLLSQ
jgi:hypothetical protein